MNQYIYGNLYLRTTHTRKKTRSNSSYKGNSKIVNNLVIDTVAAGSVISPDAVDDIGIYAELSDRLCYD